MFRSPTNSATAFLLAALIATQTLSATALNSKIDYHDSGAQSITKAALTEKAKYEKIKIAAYKEIRRVTAQGDSKNLKLKYDVSASFPKDLRDFYLTQVKRTSKLIAVFLTKEEVINVYLSTEKDAKEIEQHPIHGRYYQDFVRWFKEWRGGVGREHNLGLAGNYFYTDGKWEGHVGTLVYSGAKRNSLRRYSTQVVPHEYFHVVQDYFLNVGREFNWPDSDTYDRYSPPTFREGSANTISFVLASKNEREYLDFYRYFIAEKKQQREVKIFSELKTEADVVRILKQMENRNARPDVMEASYAMGQLLYEWLIANYGFEPYKQIVESQLRYENFGENVKANLGFSTNELYRRAAPHILAAFRLGAT